MSRSKTLNFHSFQFYGSGQRTARARGSSFNVESAGRAKTSATLEPVEQRNSLAHFCFPPAAFMSKWVRPCSGDMYLHFIWFSFLTAGQHDPQFDVHDFISNIRDALQSASPMESPPLLTPQTPGLIPPQTPVASTASLSQGPSTCRPANGTANECCLVEYSPILMESYIGLPALLHNYGQLGFYKIRGRISF